MSIMWTWVTTHFIFWTGFVCAALLLVHIIRQRHTPAGTSAWLLLIILVPYIGVPLYVFFGGRKLERIIKRKRAIHLVEEYVTPLDQSHDIDRMLRGYDIPGATAGNKTILCEDAVTAYRQLTTLIREASSHIHITTYLFKNDVVGKEVIALLAERASPDIA